MTSDLSTELSTIDLADPTTFLDRDLVAMWRRFRRDRPVHWNAPHGQTRGFWAVTRYSDVLDIYKDTEHFTSERGNVLSTLLQGNDSASGKMLAVTDGARHRQIRNLMLKSFSPRVLKGVAAQVDVRTFGLITEAVSRGSVDFAVDIADHIPINTIGDLMDIPLADRQKLVDWNTQTLAGRDSDFTEMDEWMARNEILLYFSDLAKHRRRHPGEDVVSALATGVVDGKPLSEDEIVFNCYSLILGADESSRMSSIGGILALAQHPDQWQALRTGAVTVESAVEEVLRWTTPAMHFGRRALSDFTVADTVIKADDVVTLWNSSANFDEDVFAEPDRFDLARTPNRHVAFGHGPHFCIGAFLGRAHQSAVLGALRELVSDIEILGPPKRLYSNFVYGYSSLPVRLVAA